MSLEATTDADKPMIFWAAVSLGVGAMIGAGIFALLGEAGTIARNAVTCAPRTAAPIARAHVQHSMFGTR